MRQQRQRNIAIDGSRAGSAVKTGTEWYSFELIRAMAGLPDRPSLTIYHRDATGFLVARDRVRHRQIRNRRFWTHAGLSCAMLRDRPDALFVPSHVIPLLHPPRSVVTIHDLGYVHEGRAHPWRSRIMLDLTTRWNAFTARRIIAVSGQTRQDLVQRYGTDHRKITVVHSAVNHDRFRRLDPVVVRERLSELGVERPYILFLSTVQPRKNLDRLIEAFRALDQPQLQLVVAGKSGWLSGPLEDRVAELVAGGEAVRLGYVPADAIPALYNGARAFVLPSLYEGFGMGILEAMACGCPVVTSDCSSMPEVAGDAAVLVDPHDVASIRDGIRRALAPDERERLAQAGRRRAAEFTWERTARQTLEVITGVMDES